MIRRILNIFALFALMVSSAMAQTFSVSSDNSDNSVLAEPGGWTEVHINLEGAEEMTALQFCVSLPECVTLDRDWAIHLGNATNGHTLNVSTLDSGDLLVVIYSLHSATFSDGTLLSFTVTAGEEATSAQGNLHTIRTATLDAMSHECDDVVFSAAVVNEEPVEPETTYYWYLGTEKLLTDADVEAKGSKISSASEITNPIVLESDEFVYFYYPKAFGKATLTQSGLSAAGMDVAIIPDFSLTNYYGWRFPKGNINGIININFTDPEYTVSLNHTNVTLTVGESVTLIATITPEGATTEDMWWMVYDTNIATVEDGVVTALAEGSTRVIVHVGDYVAACQVTVEAAAVEPEAKYYWYAGTTDPTTMTSIDPIIPADAAPYVYGWTEITEAPTEIRVFKESSNWQETGLFPEVQWYIAFPAEFSLGMVGGGWTKSQTVINGVLYDIWSCGTLVDTANSQFIKLETPDYTPDPETKCYWYVGTTDPRTMTNIDPIIPADAASYVYGWTEITETPTMIDVFKESSNWEETGLFPDVQWYIACPSAYGFNTTSYLIPVGGWYVIRNAVTIGGIEYDIWKSQTLTSAVVTLLAKVGEPVSKPEPTPEPEGLSTSKYYRVKNVTTGLYLQVEGNNTNMKLQNKAEGLAMMQIFGLEDAGEEKYYIKAADADNRYYAHASGWDFNATTNADSKTPFTIALVEGEEGVYTLHQSVSEYQGLAGADNSEAGSPIYCNKGIDNNGKWAFEALTAEEQAAYVAALRPITSLDELSNSKAYYVKQPQRAGGTSWAVETGAEALKSNADLGIGASCKDNRQYFAFLTNNEGGTYYLYHVAEAKFVNKDGSLSENPADAVSFTDGKYANTFVVYFDTDHYINVGGSSQMVIDDWNTPDEGNSCTLTPVADFDATEALKLIEALETGVEKTTDNSQQTTVIYDLMGRRVEKAEKGIYIVNGKKVIVK